MAVDQFLDRLAKLGRALQVSAKGTWRWLKEAWPAERGFSRRLSALGGVLASVVAVIALWDRPSDGDRQPSQSTRAPTESVGGPQTSSAGEEPSGRDAAPSGPRCLDSSGQVSCEAEHITEIVDAQDCSPAGLIAYMGGRGDTDIVQQSLKVSEVDGRCRVSLPRPATHSVAGILKLPEGDRYRACWDDATDSMIGCDEPHYAEMFYEGGPDQVDCEQEYARYVGVPISAHDRTLDIEKRSGNSTTCWAKVRLDADLTQSLRNLGDMALPVR